MKFKPLGSPLDSLCWGEHKGFVWLLLSKQLPLGSCSKPGGQATEAIRTHLYGKNLYFYGEGVKLGGP